MRIGNSYSTSYRNLMARRSARKKKSVARLCHRLDNLVTRAETFGPRTQTRKTFLARADVVREKLRAIDH
jgi:hypothetical protein